VTSVRPEEQWARQLLSSALGNDVTVEHHDDGSEPGMYDLDLLTIDGSAFGAVEISAAGDPELTALWRAMQGFGGRWIEPSLIGGWLVTVRADARIKPIKARLPSLLATLEASGYGSSLRGRELVAHVPEATDLGIVSLMQSGTNFPGSIYLSPSLHARDNAGVVPDHSNDLALWISGWLRDQTQRDNLAKLAHSGRSERHMFTIVPAFSPAPFPVAYALLADDRPAPTDSPDLPIEVTHCWIASTWNTGKLFAWSPSVGWRLFTK
jgi:hypothetical protein